MPEFKKYDKQSIAKKFAKYLKMKKALSTAICFEFFIDLGMRPTPKAAVELFVIGHKNVIPLKLDRIPDIVKPSLLKGVLFYDHENKIAYFTEISDVLIVKQYLEDEVKKLIE